MRKMKWQLVMVLAAAVFAVACGNKGSLYMPDRQGAKKPESVSTAPADQDQKNRKKAADGSDEAQGAPDSGQN